MALATNSTPGSIVLAGDLTGTANTPELRVTGVTPGSYTAADIVVDSKGRVLSASTTASTFTGDMVGSRSATVLSPSGVTSGSYTNANPTINSKGLITSVTGGGTTFSGMLTGSVSATVLSPTGITPGTYNYVGITVDSTGRVTSINQQPTGYNISSYSVNGIVQIDQNLGLTVSSGNLSGTMATSSVFGVIKTANSSNINITTGTVNVGSNVPTLPTATTFTKAVTQPVSTLSANTDLSITNVYQLLPGVTTLATSNEQPGDVFDFYSQNTGPYFDDQVEYVPSNGVHFRTVQYIGSQYVSVSYPVGGGWFTSTSPDGTTWTHGTTVTGTTGSVDLGYSGTAYVIISTVGTGSGRTLISYRSTNGRDWTATSFSFDPLVLGGFTDVQYFTAISPTTISIVVNRVAVTGTHVYTSTNAGTNWTKTTLPQFDDITNPYFKVGALYWTGTYFYMAFISHSASEVYMQYTSTNGINWSGAGTAPTIYPMRVFDGGNRVYGCYNTSWWVSNDGGITWSPSPIAGPASGNIVGWVSDASRVCVLTYEQDCNFSCDHITSVWTSHDGANTWAICYNSYQSYYEPYNTPGFDYVMTSITQGPAGVMYNVTLVYDDATPSVTYQQWGTNVFPATWSSEFKFSNTSTSGSPYGTCVRGDDGINYCTYKG